MTILVSNGDTKKIKDWITSQKPISRRHPITLNNNITDISQKKIYQSANDTIIYRLSLWYKQTMKDWSCLSTVMLHSAKGNSTLDAPKLLNDTQHSHSISQSCLLKGKKHKMLQSKKPIKQRSSRRKSAPFTSVTKPSHSFPDLSSLKFLNMNGQTTRLLKVTAPKH